MTYGPAVTTGEAAFNTNSCHDSLCVGSGTDIAN